MKRIREHPATPDRSQLTMDEQLQAFLDKWEQDRAAKAAKYRQRAEHWKNTPGMGLCWTFDLRRAEHYEHELAMLKELRARSLSLVCPSCGTIATSGALCSNAFHHTAHEWPCEHAPGGAERCEDANCPASVPADG